MRIKNEKLEMNNKKSQVFQNMVIHDLKHPIEALINQLQQTESLYNKKTSILKKLK